MVKSGKSLEEIYKELDSDGDGVLTVKEIVEGLKSMGVEVT